MVDVNNPPLVDHVFLGRSWVFDTYVNLPRHKWIELRFTGDVVEILDLSLGFPCTLSDIYLQLFAMIYAAEPVADPLATTDFVPVFSCLCPSLVKLKKT